MEAAESKPPYFPFIFIACLTILREKPPTSVGGVWAPSESVDTSELCSSVSYVAQTMESFIIR